MIILLDMIDCRLLGFYDFIHFLLLIKPGFHFVKYLMHSNL
jgi:hypothetical protein